MTPCKEALRGNVTGWSLSIKHASALWEFSIRDFGSWKAASWLTVPLCCSQMTLDRSTSAWGPTEKSLYSDTKSVSHVWGFMDGENLCRRFFYAVNMGSRLCGGPFLGGWELQAEGSHAVMEAADHVRDVLTSSLWINTVVLVISASHRWYILDLAPPVYRF